MAVSCTRMTVKHGTHRTAAPSKASVGVNILMKANDIMDDQCAMLYSTYGSMG